MPPMVRVLALTVTVRLAFSTTPPVPRSRLLVPWKRRLLFKWITLLPALTKVAFVLSSVPPVMVRMPVPTASDLL